MTTSSSISVNPRRLDIADLRGCCPAVLMAWRNTRAHNETKPPRHSLRCGCLSRSPTASIEATGRRVETTDPPSRAEVALCRSSYPRSGDQVKIKAREIFSDVAADWRLSGQLEKSLDAPLDDVEAAVPEGGLREVAAERALHRLFGVGSSPSPTGSGRSARRTCLPRSAAIA